MHSFRQLLPTQLFTAGRGKAEQMAEQALQPSSGQSVSGGDASGGCLGEAGPGLAGARDSCQGSWAGCGHRSSHWALGSATPSSSPSPARVCPFRPRRPRGPDSVAATSQRHRDLEFRTSHCLKADWWHQGLCSSAGVQGRPAGVQSPDWRENNFHL